MAKIYYSNKRDRKRFVKSVLDHYKEELNGRIFIKPNIVSHEPYPTTTNLNLLDAVLKNLKDYEIGVGDASAVDLPDFNVKNSQIAEICDKHNIKLIDLYDDMKKVKTGDGFEFKVAQVPLEYDSIISLPILKVHVANNIKITGALKNSFGYLSKGERIKYHGKSKDINRAIAELNTIFKPTITIMDGITSLIKANEVRHGGKKHDLGILLAGTDPVALDSYGLKLLRSFDRKLKDKEPEDIKQIKYALELGIGETSYELIELD